MRTQHGFGTQRAMVLAALVLGCGGTMGTGTAKKPSNNKPAADGTCPDQRSLCGNGNFAICADLQNDPNHCGTCDRVCSPGIACQAGVCQQTVCTGTAAPLSGEPTTSTSTTVPVSLPVDTMQSNQLLADVNGDGHLDRIEWLSVMGICQGCGLDLSEFRVSLGQPGGVFAPPDTYHASDVISRVFATDVNGDGLSDLYIISSTYSNSPIDPYHVELWLGQTDGHLVRSEAAGIPSVDAPGGVGSEIAMGDLSGDGWLDMVIAAPDTENPPKINVYLSDSTGALHLSQTFVAWASHTFIRDWNGDGSPDLTLLSGAMQLLYNRGDGTFEPPVDCALSVGGGTVGSEDLLVEDFNRDGWMDVAIGDMFIHRIGVMLGLGGCGFSPIRYYDVSGSTEVYLRAVDMNGDGILDLVSVHLASSSSPSEPSSGTFATREYLLTVLVGKPDGTFELRDTALSLGPNFPTDVTIGEVTGDQRPDIVVSSVDGQSGKRTTWENTCQ